MTKGLTQAGIKLDRWQPEVVVEMVKKSLRKNAPMVGKFVEDDARRRLDAIREPSDKRSVNYRNYLSKYILTHSVEEDNKGITILIGMKIGKSGQTHHGFYIETGSRTAPAQPYLRPALFENGREVESILTESAK
jgi:hypothetical protein